MGLLSGPDAGKRQEVGEVQGMQDLAPDVAVPVARETPEPGLDRIDPLEARLEAESKTR